mmetsp:Transcript_7370/g.20168  ORF Transcript_7370/g.20168 Transcript_7370/m.20168 type:complete len:83 (+) Transcript_7370:117-365(+)
MLNNPCLCIVHARQLSSSLVVRHEYLQRLKVVSGRIPNTPENFVAEPPPGLLCFLITSLQGLDALHEPTVAGAANGDTFGWR